MTKKVFLRWALLFIAANSKFASICSSAWIDTIKGKADALFRLAKEMQLIDDEPEQPP